jgi:aryl-alcohol dehydrogenase-like predicted oxidoreductase
LALGWLLADERVTQVVIGPGRPEHLAPAAEALRYPVTEAERADIEAAVAGLSGRPRSQEAPSQEAPSQEAPSQEAGQ